MTAKMCYADKSNRETVLKLKAVGTPHFRSNRHLCCYEIDRGYLLQQFADWLDSPTIRTQRRRDDPTDHKLRTYNYWIQGGVDFISLDNASYDQFDGAQVAWIERVLARDETDANIGSVVVGMHDTLVSSVSTSAAAPKYGRSRTNAAGAGRRWRRAGVCRESSLQSADHLPEGKKPGYLSTPRDSHHRVECARHCFPCARATQMVLRRTRSWNMR